MDTRGQSLDVVKGKRETGKFLQSAKPAESELWLLCWVIVSLPLQSPGNDAVLLGGRSKCAHSCRKSQTSQLVKSGNPVPTTVIGVSLESPDEIRQQCAR